MRDREAAGRTIEDATVRQLALPALAPFQFKAEQYMNGVRVTCEGRDRILDRDGAVSYRIRWAFSVDTSTQTGRDFGYAHSVVIDSLDAPGKAKVTVERLISDAKFSSGYFFAEGVDSRGNASVEYIIAGPISNQILDSTVPADVTHLQVSGSGEYIGQDVIEALSVSVRQPSPIGSFDGVQDYLKDYINVGSIQEGEFHRGNGVPGASLQYKVNYAVAKRIGFGTIILTNLSTVVTGIATKFLTQCQVGDLVECGTARVAVASVISDTSLTLVSNWLVNSVTSPDYAFYGKVTVFAVAISKGGTHRSDTQNAPNVALLFDGSLGTPNAPIPTATTLGNAIRIEFFSVLGTQIKSYRLYRGTGTGVAFASTTLIDEIPQPKDSALFPSNLQFEDSSFSVFQKEQGQIFTYYVVTVNERNDPSTPAHATTIFGLDPSCRLDSTDDTENGGRVGLKNLLYNAMFGGVNTGNVLDTDAVQDTGLFTFVDGGYTPGLPGRPYGGNGGQLDGTNRYKGYTRWAGTKSAGAPTLPTFVNGNEVKLPAPGGGESVFVFQEIGAWDELLGGGRGTRFAKMKKDGFIVFQVKVRCDAGAVPNGSIRLIVEEYNNGVLTGNAKRQYRDTSSNLLFYTGTAANFEIVGSSLTSAWVTFWAIYQFDGSLGTVKQMRLTLDHHDTTNGNPIYVSEPMVNDGTDRGAWTADMADPYISLPVPTHPPLEPFRGGIRPFQQ